MVTRQQLYHCAKAPLLNVTRLLVIDFHQTLEVNGIRFWCYTAGHVLGAAMFMVDIAGVRILYTGDYSREEDRHLKAAEIPSSPLIFALSSQLTDPQPVCTVQSPFHFKHIDPLNSIDNFHDVGPSVVMASPGSLQSGLSRQLFDKWCTDKKNTCVIPGYAVAGSLAKTIITEPRKVELANGLNATLNMQIFYISFSAHADFPQTSGFLGELQPPNIILTHSPMEEETEMVAQKVVYALMVSVFGDVRVAQEGMLVITVDGDTAYLDGRSGDVECANAALKERIQTAFRRIQGAVRPIPLSAS
ncbi:cleavage and polyadenylation specificity factor subunit 3-I-like [Aegilops tauschii subsp. strangulata]|uniref:cleavage and polyadenylation specificity factor subunit 3-I-like n=1 Tax=Aegilops tauschii subsp. strangulata TaxID=200361 RepID=UPI003CC840A8